MTTTSKIAATEGSGKNLATYSLSEDAVTKEVSRVALNDNVGADVMGLAADAASATGGLLARLRSIATSCASLVSNSTSLGAAAAASSIPVTVSTEDQAKLGIVTETAPASDTASSGLNGRLQRIAQRLSTIITAAVDSTLLGLRVLNGASQYETVAASQTAQVMGATGAAGDYLSHVIVSPGTAGCGVVTVLDNATTIAAFPGGGTTALSNLIPFVIPIGLISTSGAWKITTGANVTCVGVGKFT